MDDDLIAGLYYDLIAGLYYTWTTFAVFSLKWFGFQVPENRHGCLYAAATRAKGAPTRTHAAAVVASLHQMLTILSTFSAARLLHDIQCIHTERGEHEEYGSAFLFLIACVDSEL